MDIAEKMRIAASNMFNMSLQNNITPDDSRNLREWALFLAGARADYLAQQKQALFHPHELRDVDVEKDAA